MSKKILDNQNGNTLGKYLNEHLPNTDLFRLVSAYFSIYGYESLAEALDETAQVRFLFGEPSSAATTKGENKTIVKFGITEDGLSAFEAIQQGIIAEKCAEWVQRESVEVRTIAESNFLHGKMYHIQNANKGNTATVGSSNLTKRGLGMSTTPNIELNAAIEDDANMHAELAAWFDNIWNDKKLTKDAKEDLLKALARWYDNYDPEFIYYKTLFELFRDEIELRRIHDQRLKESGLSESGIWKKLYEFQRDGVTTIINRLLQHNGCILADSVGLGKTYTALAVIKYFQSRNENILVLCPKRLAQNWRIYQTSQNSLDNPFPDDGFNYHLAAHTDLTRTRGQTAGGADIKGYNWNNFDLIVIDESHNFRNVSKSHTDKDTGESIRNGRYEHLLRAITNGSNTKVLMLSATPVNTSLIDLQNQINLITKGNDNAFSQSLGVASIARVLKPAQEEFKAWEQSRGNQSQDDLLTTLGDSFIRLLSGITIARSRKQITQFYEKHIEEHGKFPQRNKPLTRYPHTDTKKELSYDHMHDLIEAVQFRIYQPSDYVKDGSDAKKQLSSDLKKYNFNQKTRENYLVAMMHVNLLKRLESSAYALELTLARTIDKIKSRIAKNERFLAKEPDAPSEIDFDGDSTPDEEAENEERQDADNMAEFITNSKKQTIYHLRDLDVQRWTDDIKEDLPALEQAHALVKQITDEKRDGKLAELHAQIRAKAEEQDPAKRKLLIFTAYGDTAQYLYENTTALAEELGMKIAKVAGSQTQAQCGSKEFSDILSNFAPIARNRHAESDDKDIEIDILIATDCISEGQNLQDCGTVLNYDIHWNPVRLIQRFGRIDRIGTTHDSVTMINFWPTEDMDKYLNLERRVRARMALVNISGTGDDNSLEENNITQAEAAAQAELSFRGNQIKEMQKTILDLEDQAGAFNLSDFTLDYFLSQLIRHLEKNRPTLEDAPKGIYAVIPANAPAPADPNRIITPGVIFFFRQTNTPAQAAPSAIRPHYFVYVKQDGEAHRGYANARFILGLMEQLTQGKIEAINELCDNFISILASDDGKAAYDNLAKAAIEQVLSNYTESAVASLNAFSGEQGNIPPIAEQPTAATLELITWLVLLPEDFAPPPML